MLGSRLEMAGHRLGPVLEEILRLPGVEGSRAVLLDVPGDRLAVDPVQTAICLVPLLSAMNLLCMSLAFSRGMHRERIWGLSIEMSLTLPVSSSLAW